MLFRKTTITSLLHTRIYPNTMNQLNTLFRALLACAALAAGAAQANVTVYPMTTSVGGDAGNATVINVSSKSAETQYVQVAVKRVTAPATPEEREEDVANWKGKGIVVSPAKFALPAGASRAVRVVGLAAPTNEEVYRVYFEPVAAPTDEAPVAEGKTSGSLSMSIVWGALVRALPAQSKPGLSRGAGNVIENTGNRRIGIVELAPCAGADTSCKWQEINRSLYPGAKLALPADAAGKAVRVKFKIEGAKDEVQTQEFAAAG